MPHPFLQIKCNLLQAFVGLGRQKVHSSHSRGPWAAPVKALSWGSLEVQSIWEGVSECYLGCSLLCCSPSEQLWSLGGLSYQAGAWAV